MRTIRTKVYKFNELSEKAQFTALCDQIQFEIQVMDENSQYYQTALEMEANKTPWFLAESLYHTPELKQMLIETIESNEYEFTSNGKMI